MESTNTAFGILASAVIAAVIIVVAVLLIANYNANKDRPAAPTEIVYTRRVEPPWWRRYWPQYSLYGGHAAGGYAGHIVHGAGHAGHHGGRRH